MCVVPQASDSIACDVDAIACDVVKFDFARFRWSFPHQLVLCARRSPVVISHVRSSEVAFTGSFAVRPTFCTTTAGFTLSAGIASNRLLAKLVSGTHKPNKQTVVAPIAAMEMLRELPLQVRWLCGIVRAWLVCVIGACCQDYWFVVAPEDVCMYMLSQWCVGWIERMCSDATGPQRVWWKTGQSVGRPAQHHAAGAIACF